MFQNMPVIEMPKTSPTHSAKEQVYHNNTACNTRNNIERENKRQGNGGKRLCQECERLNRAGK